VRVEADAWQTIVGQLAGEVPPPPRGWPAARRCLLADRVPPHAVEHAEEAAAAKLLTGLLRAAGGTMKGPVLRERCGLSPDLCSGALELLEREGLAFEAGGSWRLARRALEA
jgi:hypothetical protein